MGSEPVAGMTGASTLRRTITTRPGEGLILWFAEHPRDEILPHPKIVTSRLAGGDGTPNGGSGNQSSQKQRVHAA